MTKILWITAGILVAVAYGAIIWGPIGSGDSNNTTAGDTAGQVAEHVDDGDEGAPDSGPVEVEVSLTEFKIEPSQTTFTAGVPYRLIVTNTGKINHELMIMPPMTEDTSEMSMEEMDEMALAVIDAEDLPPGATVPLDVTFGEPGTLGLEATCRLPGHYESGMRTVLTIQ
jgi:uncharacterized cupredoxin-like copper-binding protein